MKVCACCGRVMGGARSDKRACSPRCKKALQRARKRFPSEMTAVDRWVRYRLEPRKAGKLAKIPIQLNGRNASSTNPATWTSFKEASAATTGDGIGWVLGNGIGCIDLDDCYDSAGQLSPFAEAVIAEHRAEAILIERSVSGRGVHIFTPMAPGAGTRRDTIEIYPPDSGRFIALTGDRI